MRRRSFGQRRAHDPEIESHGYSLLKTLDTSQDRKEVPQKPRHARSIVIALAVGLMVAACNSGTATQGDSDETVTTTTAEPADTTARDEDATTTTAATPETTAAGEDGDVDPLSQGLPGEVAALDTVETPNLGGLRFIVPEDRFIHQSPGFLVIQPTELAEILLVRVVESPAGEPIGSVDAVIALIDDATRTLDELDPATIAGLEARVLDFTAEPNLSPRPEDAIFRTVEDGVGGWGPGAEGRVWLLDTPRGIMLFNAQVLEPRPADLADVIAEAETIFATLELATPEDLVGTWAAPNGRENTFADDGEFIVAEDGEVLAEGTYGATSNTVEIIPGEGAIACDATGTYEWEVEDDTLTLTVISDECAGRRSGLDGVPRKRVQ